MGTVFRKLLLKLSLIGSSPDDSEEVRMHKALLVLSSFPFMITGFGWGVLYAMYGEPHAGLIPLGYSVFSMVSISYFGLTRQFKVFRFVQLLLILLLPCALMFALGGFISGSVVILWGLISPLGSMLFDRQQNAPRWFAAYFLLVIISGVLEPFTSFKNNFTNQQIILFFIINVAGVSSLIFLMVYYFVGKKNYFQDRAELLLLNILPKEIVEILKERQGIIADHFEGASILFADVVNFTPMSTTMSPVQIVELLNEVFSEFDLLAEKYGLEKIKTIGDCYMIAAGIPRSRADHALVITEMALEMRDYVERHEFMGRKLKFRFGINSGPVVAGVIGRKKFSYDLWGDSVNIASRMESQGNSGQVQVSEATYQLIQHAYQCSPQGTLNIKGKGEMKVWYVEGKRQ